MRASVTYAGAFAIVALSPAVAVGVDAELHHDARREVAGLQGVLGAGTEPDVRDWVRVEAALKADGRGLRVEPSSVRVHLGDTDVLPRRWTAGVPGRALPITGWDLTGPAGVLVSAAVVER